MRRFRMTVGCFAVSGALVFGATGATSAGAYATDDACKLVSTKKITKVLGQQPGMPLGQNDPVLSTCIWDLAASGDLVRVNLVATISGPPMGKAEFDTAKTTPTEAKVPGIKKSYFDSSAREIMALARRHVGEGAAAQVHTRWGVRKAGRAGDDQAREGRAEEVPELSETEG